LMVSTLNGNNPNPFNAETSIRYTVKGTQPIAVEIYNAKGQKVKTLVNTTKASGNYNIRWNGTDDNNRKVSGGIYFCKLNTGNSTSIRKLILLK
jgi:flagellar hook assembly protein FlgD